MAGPSPDIVGCERNCAVPPSWAAGSMTETPATKSYVAHWLYLFVTYAALGEQDFGNQIGELKAKTDHRPPLEQMFERCLDHINEDERNQLCEIVAKLVHAVVNGCSGAP
jgi:hypothetical protein